MDSDAISFENVSFGYQDIMVLKEVSFLVEKGAFIGIIGPNGGGKTTLLKLIMGFLKPLSGKVSIFGKDPNALMPCIAYVPQTMRFDKQFPISVLEVVLQGKLSKLPWYGRYCEEDKNAALAILKRLGLEEMQDRAFGTLSGGQAQRVLIARALVSNPKLLLLDEPTASIDSQTQVEIYTLLKELSGSMTVVMVTHDLNAAIHYVQHVICVQHTVITLQPQEVCEHFALGLYHAPLISPRKQTP